MRRIETRDELYLHGHRFEPRFFVDDGDAANGYRPRGFIAQGPPWVYDDRLGEATSLPVYSFSMWEMQEPEAFHQRLHAMLGNACEGRAVRQQRLNGRDGFYGDLVRREIGCWDTPLIDIDAVDVEDTPAGPMICRLIEFKRPGEPMRRFQAAMLAKWRQRGGAVEVVVVDA